MTRGASDIGRFVVKAAIAFVVIAGGIFAGLYISIESGVAERLGGSAGAPLPPNRSLFSVGSPLPPFSVDLGGRDTTITDLVREHRSIVAFVKNGCDPCEQFVSRAGRTQAGDSPRFQLLLISETPEAYSDIEAGVALGVAHETLEQYGVQSFPTYLAVDEHGLILHAVSGFNPSIGADHFRNLF